MWPFKKKRAVTPMEKRAEARGYVYKYARGEFNEYQLVWVLSQYDYIPEDWADSTGAGTFDDVLVWALDKMLITDETYKKIVRIREYLTKFGFFNG